ncbi:zinc finger protein CONSTANS-LIKE 6 [Daucus carota subsp. sativus]|uniref:zinc finger protein CONSTANS-LIKE 6 n=1 Tax=Daucus carota subsp. sativus TaxID=79200 RepID=UPI0007B1E124|nr:PREDICTED: zinc finger protein CONSTANS-LIKE 6 [Daucus carota subsp. sativus]
MRKSKKRNTPTLSNIAAARKSRSKTRKPKFLSLRLQLSPETTSDMAETDRRHQLDLFPLHPENLVDDKDSHEDNNVAYFFSSVDNGGAATLTGLLGANTSSSGCDGDQTAEFSPESLYGGQDSEEVEQLVRTAMRKQSREESSEEKWVSCCSETKPVLSEKKRLALKLDYQEIMDAWSDKGPLIVNVESASGSQVVPDLLHDDLFVNPSINGWGSSGALWSVPEMSGSNSNGCIKVEEVHTEDWKIGRREASVLRYREKRQNRLFSKKIRYEVRKLNAEKRPRIKGRFVKRIEK